MILADDHEQNPAGRGTIRGMKRVLLHGLVGAVVTIVIAVGTPVTGSLLAPSTAAATAPGACNSVLLPARGWLGGTGVKVFSNGAYEGTGVDCVNPGGATYNYYNGVVTGQKWQGAELVNRLYLSKGWITTTWQGSAGPALYADAPSTLLKEADGSVSHLGPGDVVDVSVFHNGVADGGEVLVANDGAAVSSGDVTTVSQNAGSPSNATVQINVSISQGSVTILGAGSGWTYTVIGVIHAPSSTVPTLKPLASTSGPAGFGTEFAVTCPLSDKDVGLDIVASSELSGGEPNISPGTYHFFEQTAPSAAVGSYSFQVDCVAGIAGNRPQWKTTHAFPAVTMDVTGPSVTPTISPTDPQRGSTMTVGDGGGFGTGQWSHAVLRISWTYQGEQGVLEDGTIALSPSGDWGPYDQLIPMSVPVGATIEVAAVAWGTGQTYLVDSNLVSSGPVS